MAVIVFAQKNGPNIFRSYTIFAHFDIHTGARLLQKSSSSNTMSDTQFIEISKLINIHEAIVQLQSEFRPV